MRQHFGNGRALMQFECFADRAREVFQDAEKKDAHMHRNELISLTRGAVRQIPSHLVLSKATHRNCRWIVLQEDLSCPDEFCYSL